MNAPEDNNKDNNIIDFSKKRRLQTKARAKANQARNKAKHSQQKPKAKPQVLAYIQLFLFLGLLALMYQQCRS